MKIKTLHLKDLLCHVDSRVEIAEHLTVFTGVSDSGKSGVLRGLNQLCRNQPTGIDLLRHGAKRGRQLGYPTANIGLRDTLRPAFGVYAVRALVDGTWRNGVANLGKRPTFGKLQENFEVHLFDFTGDLYGQVLRVALVDFIRAEMKFTGLDQLKTQIAADGQAARGILG